jgi:hypothetical protein
VTARIDADRSSRRGPAFGIAGAIALWVMDSATGGYRTGSTPLLIPPILLVATSVGALLGNRTAARAFLGMSALGAGIGGAYLVFQLPWITTPDGTPAFPFADGVALFVSTAAVLVFCVFATLLGLRAQHRKTWPWELTPASDIPER